METLGKFPTSHSERSMSPSSQNAITSRLWLVEEQVNGAHHSSYQANIQKDMWKCNSSNTKTYLGPLTLAKATSSR